MEKNRSDINHVIKQAIWWGWYSGVWGIAGFAVLVSVFGKPGI